MTLFFTIITIVSILFVFGPKPRLIPEAIRPRIQPFDTLAELKKWLDDEESQVPNLTPGAEAGITWHNAAAPAKTAYCFVYLHGFSATRRETTPLTEQIAAQFDANILHTRLAGHGVGPDGMTTPAEAWLQSTLDAFQLATQLGDKVVIVATSTGATLATWLAQQQLFDISRLHALLFLSPNFKVRSPFGFLLTWPFAYQWIPRVLGQNRTWEPENEMAARYWTHSYSTHALIEMQKTVDYIRSVKLADIHIPLAMMYMKYDPTVNSDAAVAAFEHWGARCKKLIQVSIDPDEPIHVFVGDITAPQRVAWCAEQFTGFLNSLEAAGE